MAKSMGGYLRGLSKSLQWSANPQKNMINATLWRQAKKNERRWALLHLRDLAAHSSSSLTPLERGCAVVQENNFSPRCRTGRKRVLTEIFGVQLFEKQETNDINQVLDENLVLRSTFPRNRIEYILYDISCHRNLKINSEGYLILCGPDRGIEIKGTIFIRPSIEPYRYDFKSHHFLWSSGSPDRCFYDCFLSCCMETTSGYLVVNFSVYNDGLEAKIYVAFSDLELLRGPEKGTPLEVYGTVRTSNHAVTHSQAKSILFDCSYESCAVLSNTPNGKAEIPLPLSRRVMVIPRQSDLIFDVNLFIRCNAQDISIANDSVVFNAAKRSSTITEEQIISSNHGKVKIKVTWTEGLDDGVSGTEEQLEECLEEEEQCIGDKFDAQKEGDEEWVDVDKGGKEAGSELISDDNCSKEWVGLKLDVEKEGDHGEAEPEFMSDDDCSLASFKLQDLKIDGISTRAADCTLNKDASWEYRPPQRWKEDIFEVFSIRVVGSENFNLDEIYGFITIDTGNYDRLLFRRMRGDPPKINFQGYALLEGPKFSAWDVCDRVFIEPFLFKYQDFDFIEEKIALGEYLWDSHFGLGDSFEYDKVSCKTVGSDIGHIEVNFTIYEDAVQAHLEVTLTDCSFSSSEVYGTITATNTMLEDPRASSIVFKKEELRVDDTCVRSGKEVILPLSRPIVALPLGSTLKLVVDIHSQKNSINCPLFEFPAELTGVFEKTLPGNDCFVKIKVSFFGGHPGNMDYKRRFF